MLTARATLRNVRLSPRKARLVANLIRGKRVLEARDILQFALQRSAEPIKKLLDSAVANAEWRAREGRRRIDTDELIVKTIMVDEGRTFYRYSPMPRGRAGRVRHRSSHVTLTITE
ncbi:MAG: 50S ribosomal protein L22 [Candidatus Hydrogenedentes bacterium]|jgi:large subunit ribosomal protein L22|nr:50S ribosomal protein L22 [Candidatus Hydrogenedentota bacterium]